MWLEGWSGYCLLIFTEFVNLSDWALGSGS